MKIAGVMEKVFQVRSLKDGIKVINKCSQTFKGCSAVDIAISS